MDSQAAQVAEDEVTGQMQAFGISICFSWKSESVLLARPRTEAQVMSAEL